MIVENTHYEIALIKDDIVVGRRSGKTQLIEDDIVVGHHCGKTHTIRFIDCID